jgi:hypothetical protein
LLIVFAFVCFDGHAGRTKGLAKTHWTAGFEGIFSLPKKQKSACAAALRGKNIFDLFSGCPVKIHRTNG